MTETEKKLSVKNLFCLRQKKLLFSHLSFELTAGQALLVEGPNGSGKSSLLRIAAGLASPSNGDIFWCEKSIHQNRLDYVEHLHYVGHTHGLKLGLTVIENLQLASHLNLSDASSFQFDSILSLLQLHPDKNTQAQFLSAGQKRRLALAKLFLLPKTLWILYEPQTALDKNTQTFFLSQLEKHLKQGGLCVVSSHHPDDFKDLATQKLSLIAC